MEQILTGYSEKLLNANLLTLASPDNLKRWKISSEASCGLCHRQGVGLSHILTGCPWVLKVENKFQREDRNTWRHNCVLLEIASSFNRKLKEVNAYPIITGHRQISFVPAGCYPTSRSHSKLKDFGLLNEARDWVCDFDLPEL